MAIRRSKTHVRLMCGVAGAALVLSAGLAHAAEDKRIDIAPQSLASALHEFGVQSGHQVLFKASATDSKTSPGATADGDVDLALAQLLAGTGMSYRRAGDTFLIEPEGAGDPQSGSAAGDGADGTVAALIVTAQKREENIQDVPIAMSAFTQEDLTRSQVAGGPDLMTQIPNFTFTKTNFSGYSIQIRGIGTQAISATTDPAVAVAFNNTPFIRNRFFEQEFYDLERVEVLRGPQGTLYGRNATAGVVNVISAKPKNHFEAKVSADIANYNSTRFEGMINLPLVEDKAALRIAGAWTKRDGFVTNSLTGDQIDGRDLWSARVTLGLTPTDKFTANLIYEHFEENDDRLRSGKQLCRKDLGPPTVEGVPVVQTAAILVNFAKASDFSQGCLPASLYSPDSFQTPNGFALPYGPPATAIHAPVADVDTYAGATQSRDLREIATYLKPEYTASNDTVELQLTYELTDNLTLASETGFNRDQLFSFEDFNRFATTPHTITTPSGIICNAQIGCSDRLQAGDLSTARSQQFSQEFRVSSDFEGRFNFNLGANFLRYNTEDKYYVFINTIGSYAPTLSFEQQFGSQSFDLLGYAWGSPQRIYDVYEESPGQRWTDGGDIHHLSDLGKNYFLSKNPYNLISYAAFGEAYFNVTDNLKVTAGLRWTVDKKEAPQIPSALLALGYYGLSTRKTIQQEWREPTGRLAVDWKPHFSFTDETLIYGSYVRGYKAGGANPPLALPLNAPIGGIGAAAQNILDASLTHPQTFGAEFVNAYELGTKNTLLQGNLTFNANVFYYDYTGYQISEIVDRSALNLNFDAKVWGSELEVDWRPLENLRLGFKGGYENTRVADGSKAIDLMDRTAGNPGYIIKKPFPTFPSNCIVPADTALFANCQGYLTPDLDPYTRLPYVENPQFVDTGENTIFPVGEIIPPGFPDYQGLDPKTVPNHGEGILKDLSGNNLPNAPTFTATITADYTLPLPNDWLVTLHTDLYHQSEAWTRIFNTPGYDKLKAYNNINVAAIFSNEDRGWQVMAYVKNLLDKDNITGAFLNSDDTGLTTNVFLNEPRLYGIRVTKNWSGSDWWSAHANKSGHYPYQLEFDGEYGRVSGGHEVLAPATVALFPAEHPYPLGVQNNLDWASGGGVKFTYQPQPKGWFASAGVRYGRASGSAEEHPKWEVPGGLDVTPAKYEQIKNVLPQVASQLIFDPTAWGFYNYATTTAISSESHAIADFVVGRDFGLGGSIAGDSQLSVGLRYAHFNSDGNVLMHGRPDFYVPPENIFKYGGSLHRFHATMDAHRDFDGAGPVISWEGSLPVRPLSSGAGLLAVDAGLGGTVLFGRQHVKISGNVHGDYSTDVWMFNRDRNVVAYDNPIDIMRSKTITVPGIDANLGLSYKVGGVKVSGGYRIERYFDAIDGGIVERKTYDRQFDGPYFKVAIGFGG